MNKLMERVENYLNEYKSDDEESVMKVFIQLAEMIHQEPEPKDEITKE